MGEFSPPFFSEPPSFFLYFFSYPRLWFYYIITKFHPPFQNPGSAPAQLFSLGEQHFFIQCFFFCLDQEHDRA